MKVKHLESRLQRVAPFDKPKIKLEQYPTTPHLAAHVLFVINEFENLEDKFVVDLGVGAGMLSIGASLLGAERVLGLDIDPDALEICKKNCEELDVELELFQCDLSEVSLKNNQLYSEADPTQPLLDLKEEVDVVIMNPPFGTKKKGIDMVFLQKAIEISHGTVYSLHKTSTRAHVLKKGSQLGAECKVVAEMRFDIPNMYRCHKEKSVDVAVDLIQFIVNKD
eukprot:TRINITY_DN14273_c0_g1_i1.p1 TRINITY_DN14273_c0_g1~~TRINITY_DN14273_c0_g1_i1.p1  ORF type:complete len:232 (+),score=53.45 TRINITY_DN14273_c0_g1_i1:29-697(+)